MDSSSRLRDHVFLVSIIILVIKLHGTSSAPLSSATNPIPVDLSPNQPIHPEVEDNQTTSDKDENCSVNEDKLHTNVLRHCNACDGSTRVSTDTSVFKNEVIQPKNEVHAQSLMKKALGKRKNKLLSFYKRLYNPWGCGINETSTDSLQHVNCNDSMAPEHVFDTLVGFASAFEDIKDRAQLDLLVDGARLKDILIRLVHEINTLLCDLQVNGFSCCNRYHAEACYGLRKDGLRMGKCDCRTFVKFRNLLSCNQWND